MIEPLLHARHDRDDLRRSDLELCQLASGGDVDALDQLLQRHRRWIYNLSLRLVLSPQDAEDLTQETLLRIVTKHHQFRAEHGASFSTWAYRIVVRLFLDAKKRPMESAIASFGAYGDELEALGLEALTLPASQQPDERYILEEARVGCMLGMLLCLDRTQRITYVLGEIFEVDSTFAADILEISAAAYRKRLERARRDMTQFMNEKCGLIRRENPCRCRLKTSAFIRAGWVDPDRLKFTTERSEAMRAVARDRTHDLDAISRDERYAALFRQHGTIRASHTQKESLFALLHDERLAHLFDLDAPNGQKP